jgi:polyhydroxybutyrate depolymerase
MTALLLLMLTPVVGQLEPGDHTRSIEIGNRTRSFIVHVPPSYDGSKPFPVVLGFHGGGSNAEQFARFSGHNEKDDEAGFIAVYPNGTGRFPRMLTWNGGNCYGYEKVDDVAFVQALLDDLAKVAKIDEKRIYATGMSNGAIIS